MSISRRGFLESAAGAGLGTLGMFKLAQAAEVNATRTPIGLQLYSIRHQAQKDLPSVLEAVAKMGYEGVEFAGYYGHSAAELKKLLGANGLKCCGTHIRLDSLQGDALKETIEFNQTIGNKYLVVSWMPPTYALSARSVKDKAKVYNELAEKLSPLGMLVGYHAHAHDFHKVDGEPAWNILFENTSQSVIMQLDIGNCLSGGGDPIATLKRFAGRATTLHLKEYGGSPEAVIGEGDVDWEEVFTICERQAKTDWYIVEHERPAGDPLKNVARCLKNVRKILG